MTYSSGVVQESVLPTTGVIYKSSDASLNEIYASVTNDNSIFGVYTIKVTASNTWTAANNQDINYYFTLTVEVDCSIETITIASAVPNHAYTIYDDSYDIIFTDFISSHPEC